MQQHHKRPSPWRPLLAVLLAQATWHLAAPQFPEEEPFYMDDEFMPEFSQREMALRGILIALPIAHAVVAVLLLSSLLTLFPLNLQIVPDSGRRRRSLDEGNDFQPIDSERWSLILKSLAEAHDLGQQCVERVLCQMNGVNKTFYRKLELNQIIIRFVPRRLKKYFLAFEESSPQECQKYVCLPRKLSSRRLAHSQ